MIFSSDSSPTAIGDNGDGDQRQQRRSTQRRQWRRQHRAGRHRQRRDHGSRTASTATSSPTTTSPAAPAKSTSRSPTAACSTTAKLLGDRSQERSGRRQDQGRPSHPRQVGQQRRPAKGRLDSGLRQPVRLRRIDDPRHRQRPGSPRRRNPRQSRATKISSRSTPRSIPATAAARWSTFTAKSSASTPPSPPAAAGSRESALPFHPMRPSSSTPPSRTRARSPAAGSAWASPTSSENLAMAHQELWLQRRQRRARAGDLPQHARQRQARNR